MSSGADTKSKVAYLPVVRVTPDFHRQFKKATELENRTMGQQIRHLAERWLAESDKEAA